MAGLICFFLMENGTIVEFIDRQRIVCAAVLEQNDHRLRLLTENSREVTLAAGRLIHFGGRPIDLVRGRTRMLDTIKEIVERRKALSRQVNIRETWELLSTEHQWIDVPTMAGLCFSEPVAPDYESAVIRAFFEDRRFFKFGPEGFFPLTPEQIQTAEARELEIARRTRLIETGAEWLRRATAGACIPGQVCPHDAPFPEWTPELASECIDILKSYYIFEKESATYELGQQIVRRAGIQNVDYIFDAFVNLGIFKKHENIDILRYDLRLDFSSDARRQAERLVEAATRFEQDTSRRDLTGERIFTIDGQATLDFDDAVSVWDGGDHLVVGVHIADVGHFIQKGDSLDKEARNRAASIYMPDQRIPMLPPCLAEGLCSLKKDAVRPAISTLVKIDKTGQIQDYEIVPTKIRVTDQISYHDANFLVNDGARMKLLHQIAESFRMKRLSQEAVHISLPEISIWLSEQGEIVVNRVNRESPSRMLVSELMILANWLTARFLSEKGIPTVYRSQPKPKGRLFTGMEGTLFQSFMQRKLLSRYVLGHDPEPHVGLGLDAYTTATSPIRKYTDLVTQRQVRAVLGLETPYSEEEIDGIIRDLDGPLGCVARIQIRRNRYWLLKYLETRLGERCEALVLHKRREGYQILIPEYMIECVIPAPGNMVLRPEDTIRVTIQHVNARKDVMTVFMGG